MVLITGNRPLIRVRIQGFIEGALIPEVEHFVPVASLSTAGEEVDGIDPLIPSTRSDKRSHTEHQNQGPIKPVVTFCLALDFGQAQRSEAYQRSVLLL